MYKMIRDYEKCHQLIHSKIVRFTYQNFAINTKIKTLA